MRTDDPQRELRRNQDTLAIIGLGVMAFGVWSVIRTGAMFILRLPLLRAEHAGPYFVPVMGAAVLLFLLLDLGLRVYIGLSARAVAFRGARKPGCIFAAGLLAFSSLLSVGAILTALCAPGGAAAVTANVADADDCLSSLVVELTSLVTLVELIAASVRVRRIRAAQEKGEG